MKIFSVLRSLLLLAFFALSFMAMPVKIERWQVVSNTALAQKCPCPGCGCTDNVCVQVELPKCDESSVQTSQMQTQKTLEFLRQEFIIQREWLTKVLFEQHVLPALMLFTEQISAMAMNQALTIGMFLDAKHQLETQRTLQEMTAQAHKDYHPSEGMCVFGTNVRSLAASERNNDLSAATFSSRMLQRELLSGDSLSGYGRTSDMSSRLKQFRDVYCSRADNGNGLALLCPTAPSNPARMNKDINFTATLDAPLTLALDFTQAPDPSPDEEDIFALAANLYAHNVAPSIPQRFLSEQGGRPESAGVRRYMDVRAIAAKRSVATNSFAAIAAMKSQGKEQVQPYMFAILKEMGLTNPDDIRAFLGDKPSYHAQMEVLTKKLYQHPAFYTELYDKPANVARKNVSLQAIELMQKRDIYRSLLRSEAILSVMLETSLKDEQSRIVNEISNLDDSGTLVTIP
jgi:hypothetical protein